MAVKQTLSTTMPGRGLNHPNHRDHSGPIATPEIDPIRGSIQGFMVIPGGTLRDNHIGLTNKIAFRPGMR